MKSTREIRVNLKIVERRDRELFQLLTERLRDTERHHYAVVLRDHLLDGLKLHKK